MFTSVCECESETKYINSNMKVKVLKHLKSTGGFVIPCPDTQHIVREKKTISWYWNRFHNWRFFLPPCSCANSTDGFPITFRFSGNGQLEKVGEFSQMLQKVIKTWWRSITSLLYLTSKNGLHLQITKKYFLLWLCANIFFTKANSISLFDIAGSELDICRYTTVYTQRAMVLLQNCVHRLLWCTWNIRIQFKLKVQLSFNPVHRVKFINVLLFKGLKQAQNCSNIKSRRSLGHLLPDLPCDQWTRKRLGISHFSVQCSCSPATVAGGVAKQNDLCLISANDGGDWLAGDIGSLLPVPSLWGLVIKVNEKS